MFSNVQLKWFFCNKNIIFVENVEKVVRLL